MATDEQNTPQPGLAALRLARIFGIDIRVHISVIIIFALIASSLAGTLFPQWHPDWSAAQNWTYAIIAGLLFFVSLLIHELSHSVVAQRSGIEIAAITLFLFGGVAEMKGEPKTPKEEFLIAGAGPLASFVLAFIFAVLTSMFASEPQTLIDSGEALDMSKLSAPATIFMWLSSINLVLAVFNLLPGFPMDGGRIFRAALWWRTGDLMRATEMAARVGSMFGWAFIGLGALQIIYGNTINGLWLVLIGWFIRRLALTSVTSMMLDQALRGFDVRAIMRTRFESVPGDLVLGRFIDDYLLRSAQQLWPVKQGGLHVGYLTMENLNLENSPLTENQQTLTHYMQSLDAAHCISPDISAKEAFERLANHPWPMPVVEQGTIIGIIHQADILRWFSFHKIAS